ncbi:hypothetical protein SRB17_59440 [Streptomyces sp. RB17]|uniref:PAS domain S-box protein n=1 Tax=Streptomyces sp. RB17 TaxID=2585197 RepID=UPI001294EB33|nr:PAS domain S-box protein [Streptomyces sp. RB17]MQY37936.1 hypothetical protein [Streptomyces sp. RB17]
MTDDDALMLIDETGRIIEWRRPAEELFGRSATEAVGRPVAALMGDVVALMGRRPPPTHGIGRSFRAGPL